MAPHPHSQAAQALQFLAGKDPALEDSDDELGGEDDEWEWMYDDPSESKENDDPRGTRKRKASEKLNDIERTIVGARRGTFELRVGDAVLLKAERNETWVALVTEFVDDEDLDDEKSAVFMWFSSPKDIRNKEKRLDALPNELYVTAFTDENPLDTIEGLATVMSPEQFYAKYPTGKIPRSSQEYGKAFVCRRGANTRTATYTTEFIWEQIYQTFQGIEKLRLRVESETKATRKRAAENKVKSKDLQDFVVPDDDDELDPTTPRKKRKYDALTPSKKGRDSPRKFTTPTHKRIVTKKPLEFTPLGTRILSPSAHLASPFQIARSQLHVSSVPLSLPCREEEFSTVYSYLESAITAGTGSCIYISGTPGTGKTATVREVVGQLNASVRAEELDDFIFVEINGMKVTDPHQSYSLLWEALTGDRLSPTHALSLLEREFSSPSPRRVPCVVLMDELDQLVTKNQSVMYNFFNWPNLRHSRLIVLAVANTMDLPERTLSNKISSRLGLTRITFQGYTHPQLIQIIESRLAAVPGKLVDADAVQFASRKVAQVSGDARRALDICRRAVEIAEAEAAAADVDPAAPATPSKSAKRLAGAAAAAAAVDERRPPGHVTIATIQKAIREATTSPLQQYIRCLPLATKLFLAALLARTRRTGLAEALLGDVVDEAKRIAGMSTEAPDVEEFLLHGAGRAADALSVGPSKARRDRDRDGQEKASRVLGMGAATMELLEAGLLVVEERKGERAAKVRLLIGEDEVKLALREDAEVKGMGFAS
ncbi:hypothetical protein FH972_021992 [Carpinus fangiana]|uniref:Origin recognition complex subunit 1 n=1 Tax=Carpinus fangiana TaxID=176857 RepID=A0A5N6KQY5_9ROSI|nr:hypothetical protein FH972_021992 [Carpinus fangiana]